MSETKFDSKRIARNTAFMYFRMIFLTLITLYSSRVLLAELGVEDYGLYNLIGGILAMFTSLKTVFTSSVQRFLNVAKGGGDYAKLNKIFSMGVTIHFLLAALFVFIVESVGVGFMNNLNIPSGSLTTAHIVFQFTVLSAVVTILSVPYDALIIANERMNVYAYISIIDGIFRLGIIFLLSFLPFSKLISYSVLLLVVSLIIRSMSMVYCKKCFEEAKYNYSWDKGLFMEMSQFAGWNFAGNTAYSLTNEGINFILNLFGGVVVNAARAIAYQVRAALQVFTENVLVAIRPQAMMAYGNGDMKRFYMLMYLSSRILFSFFVILSAVVFVYCEPILQIWLGNVPLHTVNMVRALMLYSMVRSLHNPIDMLFKSAACLKRYQITELFIMLLNLPAAYIVLQFGLPFFSVFVSMASLECLNLIAILLVAKKELNFSILQYVKEVILPISIFSLVSFLIILGFTNINYPNIATVIVGAIGLFGVLTLIACLVVLRKSERKQILKIVIKH